MSLDNVNHLKGQLATQLEDTRRRLEDEERVNISELYRHFPQGIHTEIIHADIIYFISELNSKEQFLYLHKLMEFRHWQLPEALHS